MAEIEQHLQQVDGVMLGRLACQNPYAIAQIHHALYPQNRLLTRYEILKKYVDYLQSVYQPNRSISLLLKPIMNMAHGLNGGRIWKESLLNIQSSGKIEDLLSACELFAGKEVQSV